MWVSVNVPLLQVTANGPVLVKSPQLTVPVHVSAVPTSVHEPIAVTKKLMNVLVGETDAVRMGATLAMLTTTEAVLPASPSESVAWAETVELAGPSGKVHWKLLGAGV